MRIAFVRYIQNACCLCGSPDNLTGEHKIKASVLRDEFGTDPLVIRRFGEAADRVKPAQSVKSKAFHFAVWMCRSCNTMNTQAADREFDHFHQAARALIAKGEDPGLVFEDARYVIGSKAYLNVFRYFAKLMCCHLAEVGAPRPLHISRFALGQVTANCISLAVGKDWVYEQIAAESGPHQYASHGGLVVYGDKQTSDPTGFHSTLSVGALRYVFFSRLNWLGQLELRFGHRKFYDWCRTQVQKARDQPLSATERLMLGLSVDELPDK